MLDQRAGGLQRGSGGGVEEAGRPEDLVRVLVAEDESLVQAAVIAVLGEDPRFEVVGLVDGVRAALEVVDRAAGAVDVILADLFLRDGTAFQLAEALGRRSGPPRLAVTTHFAALTAAAACLEAGAAVCLDRTALGSRLGDAVAVVAAGGEWSGPGVVTVERGGSLPLGEAQVLARVASGESDAEIAQQLGYSRTYVKKMLVTARTRLGARDRAHAAAMAAVLGLVRPIGPARFAPSIAGGLLIGDMPEARTPLDGARLSKTGTRA